MSEMNRYPCPEHLGDVRIGVDRQYDAIFQTCLARGPSDRSPAQSNLGVGGYAQSCSECLGIEAARHLVGPKTSAGIVEAQAEANATLEISAEPHGFLEVQARTDENHRLIRERRGREASEAEARL